MSINKCTFRRIIGELAKVLFIMFFIFFSVSEVQTYAESFDEEKEDYVLTLQERGGLEEKIYGSKINLKYDITNNKVISYDENMLKECIDKLACFDESKKIENRNAMIKYNNGAFETTKEIYGNIVNKEKLCNVVKEAINNDVSTVDIGSKGCYEEPKYIENSPSVSYARETLNKYLKSSVTYKFSNATVVLSAPTFKDWISVDENFNPVVNENKAKDCMAEMAATYNSMANAESDIKTESDGSHYIWAIDTDKEAANLVQNIKNGDRVVKEPAYKKITVVIPEKPVVSETGGSYGKSTVSGVGDTYVAINLTTQHLWFYKNGSLIVDGNIVTGNEATGCATPTGTYRLYYKQKDTVLRGPGYASPVSFWMPFNGGIGLHDANWRSQFGGTIYKTSGSHGCVNLPYSVASKIYNNITSGTYIVVYK